MATGLLVGALNLSSPCSAQTLTDTAPRQLQKSSSQTPSLYTNASVGPWGSIVKIPIFLEAPTSMVDSYPLPNTTPRWSFPEADGPRLTALFSSFGLPDMLVSALSQPSAQILEGGWIHLFPPPLAVEKLEPETRARLYSYLGKFEVNEFHHDPVLILTDTVDEWYRSSSLRPEIIAEITKLSYRRGETWAFSDLPLLLNLANNESEARDMFRAFTRTRTYLIKLVVSNDLNAESVRNYWSIGGKSFRLKSLEPLINSIKETDQTIDLDISHIIPALPRKLIYNYPGPSYATKGMLPDCHWTSLNFFNYEPHEYLLDPRLATNQVLEVYAPADPPYAYGDILFFLREEDGDAFHSCLYLADDLVFTKNGRNQLSPWIISTIQDVSRVYLSITPGRIQAYRRKDNFVEQTE